MNARLSKASLYSLLLCVCCVRGSVAQDFLPLWPAGKMPNSKGITMADSITNERIYNVATPGVWAYFPSVQENKHAAVLICPGGGYQREAYVISGTQLAKWFNAVGVSAFVLKYRLPHSPDLVHREIGPLQDAQRAMRLIRANAVKWGIDTGRIGCMGTSAGGHLASTLGTRLDDVSSIGDSVGRFQFMPNFLLLISPVIDLGTYAHIGSRDNLLGPNAPKSLVEQYSSQRHVSSMTPPCFIVHAFNDPAVPVNNSLMFYSALLEHHVPSSLHIFPLGAHSIALRNNPGSTETWTTLCEMWMKEMGFLP